MSFSRIERRVRTSGVVIYRVIQRYQSPTKVTCRDSVRIFKRFTLDTTELALFILKKDRRATLLTMCRSLPVKVFNDAAPSVTDAPLPKIEEEERKNGRANVLCAASI